jgi:hypothetical protein
MIRHNHVTNALTMAKELIINAILGSKFPTNWIKTNIRDEVEWALSSLKVLNIEPELREYLSQEQRELASLYDSVLQSRNHLAHCGFSNDLVKPNTALENARETLEYLRTHGFSLPDPNISGKGTILVSPLGELPGALYSAITLSSPDFLVILASKKTEQQIGTILEKARIDKNVVTLLTMENPYSGLDEFKQIVGKALKRIVCGSIILVNITGGTTIMGEAVRAIAMKARSLSIPGLIFGVADSRPFDVQKSNPYVVGKAYVLEKWGMQTREFSLNNDNQSLTTGKLEVIHDE